MAQPTKRLDKFLKEQEEEKLNGHLSYAEKQALKGHQMLKRDEDGNIVLDKKNGIINWDAAWELQTGWDSPPKYVASQKQVGTIYKKSSDGMTQRRGNG